MEESGQLKIGAHIVCFNILTYCTIDLETHFRAEVIVFDETENVTTQLINILRSYILPGLKYLEEKRICHGDINAQNFMLRGKRWLLVLN